MRNSARVHAFNLQGWRVARDCTIEQVADALGTTRQRITRIEKAGMASREFLLALQKWDEIERAARLQVIRPSTGEAV